MVAKLIFYHSKKLGRETMNFCPLVKWGCLECPFSDTCKGEEKEKAIAFNLRENRNGEYSLHRIKNRSGKSNR